MGMGADRRVGSALGIGGGVLVAQRAQTSTIGGEREQFGIEHATNLTEFG